MDRSDRGKVCDGCFDEDVCFDDQERKRKTRTYVLTSDEDVCFDDQERKRKTRTDVLTIKNERERQTENRTSFHKKMIEDILIHFLVRHYSKITFII